MNQRLITWGRLFRLFGLHRWGGAGRAAGANVRVTYTHEVRRGDLANFDGLVRCLLRHRRGISPAEFFAACRGGGSLLAGPSVLLTFDDGLLSSYHAARDILEGHGLRAIFFVPTAALGLHTDAGMRRFAARYAYYGLREAASLAPEEYRFMGREHLVELAAAGHAVCPHTHSHVLLRDIRSAAQADRELIRPRRILEDLLGCEAPAMAFPVGTEREAGKYAYDCIRRTYDLCFTALSGANTAATDPHRLHRDCLPADAPPAYAEMIMQGTYDVYYRLKMRRLRRRTA